MQWKEKTVQCIMKCRMLSQSSKFLTVKMEEFNFSNYWCKMQYAGGGGLEVGLLAFSITTYTEARSWELRWDQCRRAYLDSNYSHFWSIGFSPYRQTGNLPLINGHSHRCAHTLRNKTRNAFSVFLFLAFTDANTHTRMQNHPVVFDQCPLDLRAGSALFHAM